MRTTTAAILFSFSAHAFLGYSLLPGMLGDSAPTSEPIPIALVRYEKPLSVEKVVSVPALPVKQTPVGKKIEARPEPSKVIAAKLAALPVPIAAKKETSASGAAPLADRPKTAMDFMTDPQKGKVFFSYFGKLKEKIHLNLRRKYQQADDALGVVTILFVLNPDGSLVKANVITKESDAAEPLQRMALDSLKRSAPFGGFPRELGNVPVAFSLKVYFDELREG